METTAFEFTCACQAGLMLAGVEEKRPQWMGSKQEWARYENLLFLEDIQLRNEEHA